MAHAWVLACRVTGTLTLLFLFVAAFTPAPNGLAWRLYVPPDLRPADAIVVLAVSVNSDGSLGVDSMRRALSGIDLHRQKLAPRILFLGMRGEAETRGRLAVSLGVDGAAIVTEGTAPTTRHEAVRARAALPGARSILLVTDGFHMRRARALFERAGFTVHPATMDPGALTGEAPESRLRLARALGEELAALGYHKLFRYF